MTTRHATDWDAGKAHVADWCARMGADAYASGALPGNSFAAACYDQNSLDELSRESVLAAAKADAGDRAEWGLSASEWAWAIGAAHEAKRRDREADAAGA